MEKIPQALVFLKNLVGGEALSELDLFMRDGISSWRCSHLLKILEKAKGNKIISAEGRLTLNPKLLVQIAESGSLEDNDDVLDMWAGLLVTASNDENILFVDILKGLSPFQTRVLRFAVSKVIQVYDRDGLIFADQSSSIVISTEELESIYGYPSSIATIDRELDSLREKGLITHGYAIHNSTTADITPMPLALHLVMRCDGYLKSEDYFKGRLTVVEKEFEVTKK